MPFLEGEDRVQTPKSLHFHGRHVIHSLSLKFSLSLTPSSTSHLSFSVNVFRCPLLPKSLRLAAPLKEVAGGSRQTRWKTYHSVVVLHRFEAVLLCRVEAFVEGVSLSGDYRRRAWRQQGEGECHCHRPVPSPQV